MWDTLLLDCHAATMAAGGKPYGAIRDAAIAIADGRIAWIGERTAMSADMESLAGEVRSLGGAWVTPGLVDCHTHLVFGGDRAPEWEKRLKGATYEEIALAGGGILSTVKATRAASEDDLVRLRKRMYWAVLLRPAKLLRAVRWDDWAYNWMGFKKVLGRVAMLARGGAVR